MIFCKRCAMDGSAKEITLDPGGICNFCWGAFNALLEIEEEKANLSKRIEQIKKDGKGKDYDVLIGLSGGVDSSTALHHAVKLGLRPFCYSVDNGWNDPRADENIMRLVETLKVPFFRYTIDLPKFKELQAAFLRAGQMNIEIPTDHLLLATSLELAEKYNIKWILSGGNVNTESIMPRSWGYQARDLTHIKDVYRWATGQKLTGLPLCGLWKWNYYLLVKKIKTFYLLDYLDYNRAEAINLLEKEYGWKNYHEKHCESIYTWWFQNFYLFEKFGIDKRKAHYSSLIMSGQMTRKEAMDLLAEKPVYPELGIEERALSFPAQPYTNFKTDEVLFNLVRSFMRPLTKLTNILR